jgi:hypothetical protein
VIKDNAWWERRKYLIVEVGVVNMDAANLLHDAMPLVAGVLDHGTTATVTTTR